MERPPRSSLVFSMCAALVMLAGCENKLNTNFEQEMRERSSTTSTDRYAALGNLQQRLARYYKPEPAQRPAYARQEALGFRPVYESSLKKLDAEEKIAGAEELMASCRPTFDAVLAFQTDETVQAPALPSAATGLVEQLQACRDQAIAAQKSVDEATGQRAHTLRRFASSGMAVVGMMTAARGDEATGIKIWSEAEKLAAEDRPGFEFKARMLVR
ncbi:hypothetical protein ACFPN2_34830 [Steroidobacter flavus]|uniref:Lipoprotein n=1 Tax=Steroidobacter flavus TaxID=1842136 RepID=A0ABV8T4X0_9GAMM